MTSTIKVNNIQNQCGANIINESSNTITIGASGDTVTLASGASQTGFGREGSVDWQTGSIKTGDFTAVSGEGYFVNTTSGAITVTLPASPSAGDIVAIADYARTFATNNVTVGRNGSNIQGVAFNGTIATNGQSTTFVYVDGTKGWIPTEDQTTNNYGASYVAATGGTITTCGDFKIHTFTRPGTFCVSVAGNPAGNDKIEYLVVAGGGGGGSGDIGGGAGAGGFRFASPSLAPLCYPAKPLAAPAAITATVSAFPITVGAGGSASPGGTAGSNSIFSTITSAGGGGGSLPSPGARCGGSGGAPAGNGNTPPVSPAQGTNGGNYYDSGGSRKGMGGGGGAIQAGQSGSASPPTQVGFGGDGGGLPTAFGSNGVPCGSFRYYAGGGGGGFEDGGAIATGGKGGGGRGGGNSPAVCAQNGTANSGGGGGGEGYPAPTRGPAGSGGSGIVILRYKFQN